MLDGAARIGDLFTRAAEMGMPALATTDHGYVFGAYEFWKKAQGTGVKPIIGVEAYVTPGTHRTDKTRVKWGDERSSPGDDVSGSGAYTHMTLLARDNTGLHNLFRMDSQASLDQVYAKWPRVDRELLDRYGKGLIATSGCASGEIQTRLRLGQYAAAKQAASDFQDIFGKENFYCEVMDHGLDVERRSMKDLIRLARELDMPFVATNDLHYTSPDDAKAHSALLCVQSGSTMMDPTRFKFDADDFYLKSPAEMRHTWRELPEACDNTLRIAEMCEISFTEDEGRYMPRFPCPPGRERGELVRQGGAARPARALPRRHPRLRADSRPSSRPRSSSARGMPATSSSSPTSSPGPRATASGSARAVARAPARCAPTP